ncbi:DUF4912 domain-containing protein [Bacillus sp. CGMCC 1.16607]|uniref:DUF4912 domain-containing protein n=1 Tax=Bacillus sp. CGMCC 1.16607 TaxID=3351842 RepID=UPI003642750C
MMEDMASIGKNYLVLTLTKDQKLASDWKIAQWQKEVVVSFFQEKVNQSIIIFRIYDVTDLHFNGSNAHSYFEYYLKEEQSSWVVKGVKPGRTYVTEIGFKIYPNHFFPILRSNAVTMACPTSHKLSGKDCVKPLYQNMSTGKPDWRQNVSTYSYYENVNERK